MNEYFFIKGLDSFGGDIKLVDLNNCDKNELIQYPCFNTLGYIKNTITQLKPTSCFKEQDGLCVKNILNEFPIRVINLDINQDKWEKVKTSLESQGIKNFERFSAVDGTKLEMTQEIKHLFRNNDFNSGSVFIGCALSHIKLWNQLIRDETTDYYIIMEDDFELVSDFRNKLNISLHQLIQKPFIDLHFLGYLNSQGESLSQDYPLLQNMDNKSYMGGFYGYVISKSAAFKLLNISKYYGVQNTIDKFTHTYFDKMVVSHSEPHLVHSKRLDLNIQANSTPVDIKAIEIPDDSTKVKFLCNYTDSKTICDNITKLYTENGSGKWKNIKVSNTNEADYFVIINKPKIGEYYNPLKTIYFQMEPWVNDPEKNWGAKTWGRWSTPEKLNLMKVFSHKNSPNVVSWGLNKNYNEILKSKPVKDKELSVFISQKNCDEGHIKSINFMKHFEEKASKITCDIYGKFNHGFKNHKGELANKEDGLFPYKYTICVENNSEHNYITEKLYDGILAECLCFYWGAPNADTIINPEVYIKLDLDNFESAYETIIKTVENNEWEKRIDAIRAEKTRLLNQEHFLPVIEKILNDKIKPKVEIKNREVITYVFSWKRVSENARNVFDEIRKVHKNTYIINCDENFKMERENVIEADDSYWFSKQFFTCLRHCKENHPDSYFMTATGDVSPDADWKDIIERTKIGIEKYNAGVMAPNVDYTWHSSKKHHLNDNFWFVENPDCTVWTLHPDVYNLLLKTDFEETSKIGWGIDLIAVRFANKINKNILRDYTNTVLHPKDRGYTDDKAGEEYQKIQMKWVKEWMHLTL